MMPNDLKASSRGAAERRIVGRQHPLFTPEFVQLVQRIDPQLLEGAEPKAETLNIIHSEFQFSSELSEFDGADDAPGELVENGRLTDLGRDRLRSLIAKCKDLLRDLKQKGPAELRGLERELFDAARRQMTQFQAQRVSKAREADEFAFFNEPEMDADYGFWLTKPSWSFEEALLLSLGKDPRAIRIEQILAHSSPSGSEFRAEAERRMDIFRRAYRVEELTKFLRPRDFVEWLKGNKLDAPELHAASTRESRPEYSLNSMHKLYQILLLYAFEHFNFRLREENKTAVSSMLKHLQKCGVLIDEKTLNKHLRKAEEHVLEKKDARLLKLIQHGSRPAEQVNK